MESCNIICAGECQDKGCALNLLDPCGKCINPENEAKVARSTGEVQQLASSRDALVHFIASAPEAQAVREALKQAIADKRAVDGE